MTDTNPLRADDLRERIAELIKVAFEPDATVEKAYQIWKGEHFKYADYWSDQKITSRAQELADAILALLTPPPSLASVVADLLSVMDYGDEDESFADDEAVSYRTDADGNPVDDPMTFGHIRRVRTALTISGTGWREPDETPATKGTETDIIVCTEREGKRYVWPGLYLREHELEFDSEPWVRKVTGFYYRDDQEEGCPYYRMDELTQSKFIGWQPMPLPQPKTGDA